MTLLCLWAVGIENEERTSSPNSIALWTGCINSWAAGQSLRKLNQGKHKASSSLRTLIQVSRGTRRSRPVAVHASRKLRPVSLGRHMRGLHTHTNLFHCVPSRGNTLEGPFLKEKRSPLFIGVAEVLTWQYHSITYIAHKHPCQTTSQMCCNCTACMQQ
jgi:hypothetical protein